MNRSDLMNFFGVSVPQASLDLAKYRELAPQNITYDGVEKAYIAGPDFSPILAPTDAHSYLNQVLGMELSILQPNLSFIGPQVSAAAVRDPSRNVEPLILRTILRAIRSGKMARIMYQSMTNPSPTTRTISPHAIAFDGSRWHIRAYCHVHGDFRDFVFARVMGASLQDPSPIDPSSDAAWKREVVAIIEPNPLLTEAQRRAIELDFAMTNGQLALKTREALLFYLLRHLGLLPKENRISEHVILANRDELAEFFAAHGFSSVRPEPE